jgi:hypothetical protein
MALRRVAELVNRAAQDTGILEALKHDPVKLRSVLKLTGAQLEALNSASTFPLPPAGKKAIKSATTTTKFASLVTSAKLDAARVEVAASGVPGNGGSLLPPEGSGQFTGGTGFSPPAPGTPPPEHPPAPPTAPQAPSGPGTKPPAVPRGPGSPPQPPVPFPQAPTTPTMPGVRPPASPPQTPSIPPWAPPTPSFPGYVPPAAPLTPTQPSTAPSGCQCACCAMTGLVAELATTAITAITAISAIAAKRH